MKQFLGLMVALVVLAVAGCGGGGGGGSTGGGAATVAGRIVWVESGSSPVPAATVQLGERTVNTDLGDGSFQLSGASGPASLLVVYRTSANADPLSFRFDVNLASGANDVGDLWIGPRSVTVRGKIVDAVNSNPLAGVVVSFAGRKATTSADGRYAIAEVAYSDLNLSAFLGIEGRCTKAGYLSRGFFASDGATGNVVTIDDVFMTSESSNEPPPVPFTIEGVVGPSNFAPGTVVTLLSGGQAIRQTIVGQGNRFSFFVGPGIYILRFNNPGNGKTAPDALVTVVDPNQPVRQDATLQ